MLAIIVTHLVLCILSNLNFLSEHSSSKPENNGRSGVGASQVGGEALQQGGGATLLQNSPFLDQLATLVSQRLHPVGLVNPNWSNYERREPTVVTETAEKTTPPVHFSNPIYSTDLNTSFDEEALLKKVPKRFKKDAIKLLKKFDEQPNDITWDAAGHIYINEQVLPNANINDLFPQLFKTKISKRTIGINDFIAKLESMGLSSMTRIKKSHLNLKPDSSKSSNLSNKSQNWWYLGE